MSEKTLDKLKIGEYATIKNIDDRVINKHRLLELGFTQNTRICPVKKSLCGDPTAYLIKDTVVALRKGEARGINIISI